MRHGFMRKVSVLVPSYNAARYLSQAIDSALNQTFQDFEIIIIDDGSTDNTREIVERYLKRAPDKIRYIYQDNQGLARARNTGLRHARGEYVALLDADDVWLPARLEETVKILDADSSAGIAHANITRISETGDKLDTPRRDARYLSGYIFENIFLRDAHLSCPTVLFRRKCCEEVGGFDPGLTRLGCEDRELWLRISQKFKIQYIDKVLALYRVSGKSMSQDKEKMMQARMYVIDKFCPADGGNRQLRRKALAKIHHDLGDELLFEQKFKDSQRQYFKSITLNPFSAWSWINFFKALLKIKVNHA